MAEYERDTSYARPSARILNTVRGHAEKHKEFTESALRNLIFFAETNGFADCILRVGRKVLIDEDEFFRCIDRLNGKCATSAPLSQTNSSELNKSHSKEVFQQEYASKVSINESKAKRAGRTNAAGSRAKQESSAREDRGRLKASTRKRSQPGERRR